MKDELKKGMEGENKWSDKSMEVKLPSFRKIWLAVDRPTD